MNKKDLKVGQTYKVVRDDVWMKTGSFVTCVKIEKVGGYDARFKVRIDDVRDEQKRSGHEHRTPSGQISNTFREFWLHTANLELHVIPEDKRKIGDKFRVINKNKYLKLGAIVVLTQDDGSDCLLFKCKKADITPDYSNCDRLWLDVSILEPYKPEVEDRFKDLKEAHAKGAKIQMRRRGSPSGVWYDVENPKWEAPVEYRIKPEKTAKPKFKAGDLCMFVGTAWSIRKNTIVKYVGPYGDSGANVETPNGFHACVNIEDLKPYTPTSTKDLVGGYLPGKLTVFAGKPSPSASAYFELQVAKQVAKSCSTQPNPQQEETPMKFETKYFLNGSNISAMSDMEIYAVIKDAEDAIEKLEQIANKPKSLQKNIADRKAELAKLVEFLDSREPKAEA